MWDQFKIQGNSMSPLLEPGTIIYVNRDKTVDIREGDVIVYQKQSLRCHRVIKVLKLNGKKVFLTKGDNNKEYDNYLVYEDDIIGHVELDNPFSGKGTK